MGLFTFIKGAGEKIFGKKKQVSTADNADNTQSSQADLDAQKAVELEELVKGMGFDIQDLYVEVSGDQASIHGKTASNDTKEMAVLVCGNVEGIATVDDRIELLSFGTAETETKNVNITASTMHTVIKGDSLSKIAKHYYGNALKYPIIFEANRPMLSDPNRIYPGQVLRIPPLENA